MDIYTAYGVLIEVLRTQLLEYALSHHQKRAPHKVLKRHKRIMLVMELIGEQKTQQHKQKCADLSRCLELYSRLIPEMLKAEVPEQVVDIYQLLSNKITNISKIKYEKFGNLYMLLMTTGMKRHQMSEQSVLALMSESIHRYVNVDVQKGLLSQRLIMKTDADRQIGVKELMTDYIIKAMSIERRAQMYEQLKQITQQINRNCKSIRLLFAGGTGQYVSMVTEFPKQLDRIRQVFAPSDVDLKVNSNVNTPELLKRAKHELIDQIADLQIPTALSEVFTFDCEGIQFKPRPVQFYRNVRTDGNLQHEYYRFKRNESPLLLDIIEIYENRNLVTIAVRLRFVLTASLIKKEQSTPEGVFTFRTDLMDIAISASNQSVEGLEQGVREMKQCGNDLVNELEYQTAPVSDIFNNIRHAIQAGA